MSIYDQLVFSDRPKLYLASSYSGDASLASEYVINNNNLTAGNNPIVSGNASSFQITSTTHLDVTNGKTTYQPDVAIEFVAYFQQPSSDIGFLINPENSNGLYVSNSGLYVKMYSDDNRPVIVRYDITDWKKKLHVVIRLSDLYIRLNVNGIESSATYTNNPLPLTNHLSINGLPSGFAASFDEFGVFYGVPSNRNDVIDDTGQGYQEYAAKVLNGQSTLFQAIRTEFEIAISSKDFTQLSSGAFVYYYKYNGQDGTFALIEYDNALVPLYYSIDNGSWILVSNPTLIALSHSNNTVAFIATARGDFKIRLITIPDGSLAWHTPALLTLTGMVSIPAVYDECIVNIPEGIDLSQGSYIGSWNTGANLTTIPQSIELVFLPKDSNPTTIFSSIDGYASYGTGGGVSGYTAYLNGVAVIDLSTIKLNQWNHLVLTIATPIATSFYLNTTSGGAAIGNIKYMLMGAYTSVLTSSQITALYNVIIGLDALIVSSSSMAISEGAFTGGSAVNIYSYAWAIQGAGG